jgi:hypothetical protein
MIFTALMALWANASHTLATSAPKAEAGAPGIAEQPVGRIATASNEVTFSLSVTGAAPFVYQWWKNDVALTNNTRVIGATGAVLNIDRLEVADSGNYFAIVTNSAGSVTSSPVSLVVSQLVFQFTPMGGTGALINLFGQIGDVYRIEVNVNFEGYRTNAYVTNFTGMVQYFDRDTGGGIRQVRARFDRMLPILYPARPGEALRTFHVYGELNQTWRIQGTSDFQTWNTLDTVVNTRGWIKHTEALPTAAPHRFYRIAPPP